jgi:hypothetical protein
MRVTDSGGAAFTPCPEGTHLARFVQLIDLGTVTTEYEGERKAARKVLVGIEVLSDEHRRDDGQPYIQRKRYTQSLHPKSALRKDLVGVRGRDFTPEELKGFDLAAILGKLCLISVVHTTKENKTFANIASLMKPPKGMAAPEGTCNEPLQLWDMNEPDWAVFAALPPRLVEQIESSPEYQTLTPPAGRIPLKQAAAVRPPAPLAPPAPTRTHAPAAAPVGTVGSGFDDFDEVDF